MRVHAQKQSQPKQEASLHPNRLTQRTFGKQATPELPHATAEGRKALQPGTPPAPNGFAHDFSLIPAHSKEPLKLQTKLTVNMPGDIYEQEADRVAERVTSMPEPQVGAQAYTVERDMVFGAAQYSPKADRGRGLPVREPAHVTQQNDQLLQRQASGAAQQAATQPSKPRVSLSLVEKIKVFQYKRKRKKLQSITKLTGEDLKREMDKKYEYESWYYVPASTLPLVSSVRAWTPISDLADLQDDVTVTRNVSATTTETLFWKQDADDPFPIDITGVTGTITVIDIGDDAFPDVVKATQNGKEIGSATVQKDGDKLVVGFDSAEGNVVELVCESNPENIRNTANPTAETGGLAWGSNEFRVIVEKSTSSTQTVLVMPRYIGPYSGSLSDYLSKSKRKGVKLITN